MQSTSVAFDTFLEAVQPYVMEKSPFTRLQAVGLLARAALELPAARRSCGGEEPASAAEVW